MPLIQGTRDVGDTRRIHQEKTLILGYNRGCWHLSPILHKMSRGEEYRSRARALPALTSLLRR